MSVIFNEHNLAWVDLETTGLSKLHDEILEVGVAITDQDLNILTEISLVVDYSKVTKVETMNNKCIAMHTESNLLNRCRESRLSYDDIQHQLLAFLKQHVPYGKSPMCGCNVPFDRAFLERYMPHLNNFFHYRNLDVLPIRTAMSLWAPSVRMAGTANCRYRHSALEDIKDHVAEMKVYRNALRKAELSFSITDGGVSE